MKKITLLLAFVLPFIGFSQFNVTFQVDMNQYTATNIGNVEVFGSFNNWAGGVNIMSDANSDGIYEATVAIPAGAIEYLFFVDSNLNYEYNPEDFSSTQPFCTTGNPPFVNRSFTVTGDTTLSVVCWESCTDCASTPSTSNVTFRVDMNNYTSSYTDVHLNGDFNNWCGNCAPMDDTDGDGIYELTINNTIVNGDTTEYKFTVDNFTDQEMFAGGEPCTKTTIDGANTFINRFIVVGSDTTLPDVCWGYCVDCASIGTEENWISDFSISPNPSTGLVVLTGQLNSPNAVEITLFDIQGKQVYASTLANTVSLDEEIDLQFLPDGIYMMTINNGENVLQEQIVLTR